MIQLDHHRPIWLVVREQCRACRFRCVSVVDVRSDLGNQPCRICKRNRSWVTHVLGVGRGKMKPTVLRRAEQFCRMATQAPRCALWVELTLGVLKEITGEC